MASTEQEPIVSSASLPQCSRTERLNSKFAAAFNTKAEFYVLVPGRVNLIGEHIDYSGYGVCPMALEQNILLAVSRTGNTNICLRNDDEKFENFDCEITNCLIELRDGAPKWYQYFLCGVKGICEHLSQNARLTGINVMVSGTIPPSAGLSSSSALVVAAALATAHANDVELTREEIASICAKCERYIGTESGGMDQAIAMLASKGCAKLIKFDPLRSEDVQLPPDAVFVIAHSLAELNKASTSDYNCRVVECRLAAQIVAKKHGLEWRNVRTLRQLQTILETDLEAMIMLVAKHLHEEPYAKDEILTILTIDGDELERESLSHNTKHLKVFKLFQRASHVYQEALRVQQFYRECSNPSLGRESTLKALGDLMTASHQSLRDLYECSHPHLDRLVALSKSFAYGARLTGAGWGGCIVALLARENLQDYVAVLRQTFYEPMNITQDVASILFATKPQAGAAIYKV